jgi:hypothetical protein
MKPRLIFLGLICVLLYTWYQLRILPYGMSPVRVSAENVKSTPALDSNQHAITQSAPEVW